MSDNRETTLTDHAMLVVWGQYAHCMGLIRAIQDIPLGQKTVEHSPQGKVLEFLVAILGGLEYLKDISLSARPVDKDLSVARAWGQTGWADHSGVSRTLSQLSEENVAQIAAGLERVTQPLIDQEVVLALGSGYLELDGDLSPRPVSNSSKSYPEAAYGHMNNQLRLGYQAAIVSLRSPSYGRIGLSATQHAGKTVSATQAEALVLEGERRLGRRPMRRTDLLTQRLALLLPEGQKRQQRVTQARQSLAEAEAERATVAAQVEAVSRKLEELQALYAQQQRSERPNSSLAQVRQQVQVYRRRRERRDQQVSRAREWLARQEARWSQWQAHKTVLEERLLRFQAENGANFPCAGRLSSGCRLRYPRQPGPVD